MQNHPFVRESIFLLAFAATLEIAGNAMGLYQNYPAYDIATHFIGGALVSSLAIGFLAKWLKQYSYAVNVVFTLGVGAAWEMIEFIADFLLKTRMQGSLNDTMVDLIMVLLAGIIVNFIYYSRKVKPY